MHLNVEIKAKCHNPNKIREILESKNAENKGLDNQIDTYFKVNFGRLKLREGNIENYLIHYYRENKKDPKESQVLLFKSDSKSNLKEILTTSLGILTIVNKKREIYFIGNVKFHIDDIINLGSFIEIEAIDYEGNIGRDRLLEQCHYYLDLFNINREDLIDVSYSDLLLNKISKSY